ncbi:hypothetical protein L596_010079 [Steinernema carpocapsae]|uniref:Uncharacterized protein n=1 Tax=Steinernema carpocapsae TaxID=34508 RepID=A0A4U5PHR3_STECR|nr:hypothetical protein L596_010079 [Steinernema carpocapsae]
MLLDVFITYGLHSFVSVSEVCTYSYLLLSNQRTKNAPTINLSLPSSRVFRCLWTPLATLLMLSTKYVVSSGSASSPGQTDVLPFKVRVSASLL